MALANYTDLKSAVAAWLVRTDLTDRIPDFITMAEARINRELRCREMIETETGTASGSTLATPSDYIETMALTPDTASDVPLEYRPPADAQLRAAGVASGAPKYFTIKGTNFVFYPSFDSAYGYTLEYYAQVPALSDSNADNWLLLKAPDIYLAGALYHGFAFLLEEERKAFWDAEFEKAKASLHTAEMRTKRTSAPRIARVLV